MVSILEVYMNIRTFLGDIGGLGVNYNSIVLAKPEAISAKMFEILL